MHNLATLNHMWSKQYKNKNFYNNLAWTAICVQNVDVHVSCNSHNFTQFAAFFIDPQAK